MSPPYEGARRGLLGTGDDQRTGLVLDVLGSLGLLAALCVSAFWFRSAVSLVGPASLYCLYVAAGSTACLAMAVGLVCAALYLWRTHAGYDTVSQGSVEVGLGFAGASVLLGAAWTRWTHGAWWVWDPSSVVAVVLWLVCLAYSILRRDVSDPERAARLGAAYIIPAFLSVPLTLVTLAWRQDGRFLVNQITAEMVIPVLASGMGLLLLYVALLRHRSRLALFARTVISLRAEAGGERLGSEGTWQSTS